MRFVVERRVVDGRPVAFRIIARKGRASVGHVGAHLTRAGVRRDGPVVLRIGRIDVVPGARRQGVATALYERAARLACKEFGAPLASDSHREPAAEAFWRKQHKKGRAVCGPDGVKGWSSACAEYLLTCPAPKTLAGRGKRR